MAFYDRKGTDPARIEVRMEKERAFEEFPGLTGEELEAVNDLYQHYLFYERVPGGRRFWTSCCHETGRVLRPAEERTAAGTVWPALSLHHGAEVRCPFCGRAAQLKAKGTARRCSGLEEYIPVVFLSAADGGETVYAQAYWTVKDYRDNWAAEPLYHPTYVYRFRRGEAVQWENGYGGIWLRQVNGFFKEPFRSGGSLFIHYDDYRAAGLECLKASFLRYIDVEGCRSRSGLGGWWNLMRTLALAAQYPENVEMLQKAGMTEVLDDWTRREKKNAAAIRWGETDPRRAFGLNGQELKEFLSTGRRIGTVALYKQLRRRNEKITVKETAAMAEELGDRARELVKLCRAWELPVKRALRYLGGGAGNLGAELQAWKDYLDAAQTLGYPLYRKEVLLPPDLHEAHETATGEVRRRLEAERKALRAREAAERRKAEQARREELELRYGYARDGLVIRAPADAEEIRAEGQALRHCVGGYAERHAEGKCTILFLRREKQPDKPFLTIEMNGAKLVQIHGYRNEGLYTSQGRFAPDPREVYREFLDPWLAWVAKGSPRGKEGEPRLPRRKKKKAEVRIA